MLSINIMPISSCCQLCIALIAWALCTKANPGQSQLSKPFYALQRRVLIGSAAATAGVVAAYRHDLTQLQFDFFSALGPFLRLLDAETSHNVAIWTAQHGITPQVLPKLQPAAIACRLLLSFSTRHWQACGQFVLW